MSEVLLEKDYKKVEGIVLFLEKNGVITPSHAEKITGKSSATVRRYLKMLVDTGYIEATGSTNNVEYIVAK